MRVKQLILALMVATFLLPVAAYNTAYAYEVIDVTTGDSAADIDNEALDNLNNLIGDLSQFLSGPWAILVIVASMVLAIGSWIWAPSNQAIGWLLRVVAGGILLITMSTWLFDLGGT